MKKIYIFGWFGEKNLGDDLLLEQVVKLVKEINADSKISVCSNNYKELNYYYRTKQFEFVPKKGLSFIKSAFLNYNLYIFGPGGLFPNNDLKKLWLIYIFILVLKILNKNVIFLALGIENCNFNNKTSNKVITKIINKVNACTLRYDYTMYNNEELNNCIVSADLIFTKNFKIPRKKINQKYIIVALANIFESDEDKNAFISEFNILINKIILDGYEIHFLTFTNNVDYDLNQQIINELGINKIKCKNLDFTNDINVIIKEIYSATFVIGMRYHSLVLSLNLNAPILPLSYSSKTEELLHDFQLENLSIKFCCDMKKYFCKKINLQHDKLLEKYDYILNNYDLIKSQIKERLVVERAKAKYNNQILLENLKSK